MRARAGRHTGLDRCQAQCGARRRDGGAGDTGPVPRARRTAVGEHAGGAWPSHPARDAALGGGRRGSRGRRRVILAQMKGRRMPDDIAIGLVVPFATDQVPDEGMQMYPHVRFIARGVGVRSLTPEGYDAAVDGIVPAAEYLAGQNVDAIMVIGTSLTFYRGPDFHAELLAKLKAATGLPVSTMSQAIIEGLNSFGARRIAVATAYAEEVNNRLKTFLAAHGFDVLALEGFGLIGFGDPHRKSEQDIAALGTTACVAAPGAEALVISCGGLRTLGVAAPLERQHGIPVVASTQAAFWAALRLAGESGTLAGYGRLLAQAGPVAAEAMPRAAGMYERRA